MLFKQGINETNMRAYYPAIFAESKKETGLSDRYLFIPTYKLIEGLQKEGFKVVGASQSSATTPENRRTAKHVVYLSHADIDKQNLLVGEEIPLIALKGSHGGQSSFEALESFFRLACSNGLMMPSSTGFKAKIRHTIGMADDVLKAVYTVMKDFPEKTRQIVEMKQIGLNRDEKVFLAESARNLIFDEEQIKLNSDRGIDLTSQLLYVRRDEDKKDTLWNTFNTIQENAIKGGNKVLSATEKGNIRYAKTRPVGAIERNIKLNQELMALALKMKELKAGS